MFLLLLQQKLMLLIYSNNWIKDYKQDKQDKLGFDQLDNNYIPNALIN